MLTDRAGAQEISDKVAHGATSAPGASAALGLNRVGRSPIALAVILLVGLLAWLPGALMMPPLDRDESRFAEASRQMVETGNFVDIRFASGARYNKPVGIYWLQAAAAKVVGKDRIAAYRLPSLLGGILSMLILFAAARQFVAPEAALLASLLLGTCLLLTAETELATTDAALLACVVGAQVALMRTYLAARDRGTAPLVLVVAGWAAIGAGILLKGPVIVAVAGVTALGLSLWDRDATWLRGSRPVIGAAVVIAIVAPWAVAIGFASHGAFYQQSLGHDFAAKITGGVESHGAPPGYYLALASVTFWPAIILLVPALAFAISRRTEPVVRFLLVWSGAVWLLFECVPTKLPHYILPAYPALALLAALWADRPRAGGDLGWEHVLRCVAAAQFASVAVALAIVCIWLPAHFGGSPRWPLFIGIVPGLVATGAGAFWLLRRHDTSAAIFAIASALIFYLLFEIGVTPQLKELWLSPRAAELIATHGRPGDPPVTLAGYVEPSLVFLLGSDTRIESGAGAGRVAAGRGGLVLVDRDSAPAFLKELAASGAAAKPLAAVTGLDYSIGRDERLTLYRVTPKP